MSKQADAYELNKLKIDMPPLAEADMNMLKRLDYSGMTFQTNATTVTGDFSDNNTVILDNYGQLQLMFYQGTSFTSWAKLANDQIMGKWPAGEKPTGSIERFNHKGDGSTTWHVERYHLQRMEVGPFNSKNSSQPLEIHLTFTPEKFVLA